MSDTPATLTAADVMQVAVKTVPSTMTLSDLEDELLRASVSGFPVVDEGKLVGVVSRSDVVRRISSEREIAERTSDFYFDETGFYEDKMDSWKDIADRVGERLEGLLVGDVMAENPHTIAIGQPITEIAERFIRHHVHRLPVIDRGSLVGIVTTMDLVRLIAEGRVG
jgi:CBS domain-containing protein